MILLVHEGQKHEGQPHHVALSEGKVAGEPTPARKYEHEGKFLAVDGPDHVVHEDAHEILKMPGYRHANADEQQEYASKKKKAHSIKETSKEVGK